MNIIVKPHGSDLCYCRPDTTWERENRDFYSPECVNEIYWTPIAFARISKAGKCIGAKFAERYYDAVGCGMLLYCNNTEIAFASCIDHTSILPHHLFDPTSLNEGELIFAANDTNIPLAGVQTLIEDAICKASRLTSLRIGDFVAVELATPKCLATREGGEVQVKGVCCNNAIFDFKIIF